MTHRIYFGDNLPILREMPESRVDLIYIDLPFNTGRPQKRTRIKKDSVDQIFTFVVTALAVRKPKRLLRPEFGSAETGYPTQKPLGLLRRIVRASSNPGDLERVG